MKKITKKAVKPAYIVDITKCKTVDDVKLAFAKTKFNAGVPLSGDNLMAIVFEGIELYQEMLNKELSNNLDIICEFLATEQPKLPWYKRAWNWLKKPFTKK